MYKIYTVQEKFCITKYFRIDIMLNQLFSNRHNDKTGISCFFCVFFFFFFFFCYFSVTHTLMFLLTSDKTVDRIDPSRVVKSKSSD